MLFDSLRGEMQELKRQLQEVQSTAYVVFPVEEGFNLIAYLDIETTSMGYTVTNPEMIEIKLLSDMPASVLVSFGKFVDAIERWQSGDIQNFPFSDYTRENLDDVLRPTHYIPPDHGMDGDEGKLQ